MSNFVKHFKENAFADWKKSAIETFDAEDIQYIKSAIIVKDNFGWRIEIKGSEGDAGLKELAYIDKESSLNDNLEDNTSVDLTGHQYYYKTYPGKKDKTFII